MYGLPSHSPTLAEVSAPGSSHDNDRPILGDMTRLTAMTGALLTIGTVLPMAAQRSTHEFEGHKFSLELPTGYQLQADASPQAGLKTFGFSTDARSDGTRGLIQVTLLDLSGAPQGQTVTLDRFAAAMLKGVSDRRSNWEQTESELQIAGVRAKRIAWAGSREPGFGRPAVHMRGVMIAGIKKPLGFTLHTQDVAAYADATLPLGEQALQTFALTLHR